MRMKELDALRGFSLFGIILTHTTYSFLETTAQPSDISNAGNLSFLDTAIKMGVQVFATGKFYSIFSFLFGLSFALQLQSAKRKNMPFMRRFVWRLAILLLIGYVHTLLYPRDILQIYALLGVILIFCTNWSNKKLLISSGILFVLSILSTLFAPQLEALIFPFITYANGYAISDVFGVAKFAFLIPSGRAFVTIALFMLGLYAGRKDLFKNTLNNRNLFQKLFIWGGVISVTCTAVVGLTTFTPGWSVTPTADAVSTVFTAVQKISLSTFFVASIVKLYRNSSFLSNLMEWIASVGKIGLTVYVTQSLFLVAFYEIALEPEAITYIGLASAVAITLIFYAGQMVFAHWWVSNFRLGPLEWFWRSLTYLKLQPMRVNNDDSEKADTTSSDTVLQFPIPIDTARGKA